MSGNCGPMAIWSLPPLACVSSQETEKMAPFVHLKDLRQILKYQESLLARPEHTDASERIDWLRYDEAEEKHMQSSGDGDEAGDDGSKAMKTSRTRACPPPLPPLPSGSHRAVPRPP